MKPSQIFPLVILVFLAAVSCCRKTVNEIVIHDRDLGKDADLEYLEFPFGEDTADSLVKVSVIFPDSESATHKVVPWAAGNRCRVGYSFSADSVYFAYAFSEEIRTEEDGEYIFRRSFSPTLRVIVGRSSKNISEAVTLLHGNLDLLSGQRKPDAKE